MRRRLIWMLLLTAPLIIVMSCGDDDDPPSGVSFAVSEESTTESDGTITSFHPLLWQSYASSIGATGASTGRDFKVKIVLDRPAAETSVISYSLSGTAIKNSAAAIGDFDLDGTTLTINKGESEAYITLKLYEDFDFFEFEDSDDLFKTIIITLNSVVSGPVTLSETGSIYTLTVNEDDLFVLLQWNLPTASGVAGTDLDTDMDMFLWNGSTYTRINSTNAATAAQYTSKSGNEYFSIPGGFPNATYGLSYVYYSGSSTNLAFRVTLFGSYGSNFYDLSSTTAPSFTQTYSQSNINVWDDETDGKQPQIVQTIAKSGLTFSNASSISKPAQGSRIASPDFSLGKLERKSISADRLLRFKTR